MVEEVAKPVVLVILDGWGLAPPSPGNAITLAKTPVVHALTASYPHTQLQASGEAVGLPAGQAGNSEVGHLNLGSGKIVYQDLLRINMAIADGTFFKNPAFLAALTHVKKYGSNLHLMGLVGPGGVHSFVEHLYALLWFCGQNQIPAGHLKLHLFTDGRDAPPKLAMATLSDIEEKLKPNGGQIASLCGRYYAMDRDNRWNRTQRAYEAIVLGIGQKAGSARDALQFSYNQNHTDEFVIPTMIVDRNGNPLGLVKDNDALIFFNFRPDRARQLTKAFVLDNFDQVEVKQQISDRTPNEYKALSMIAPTTMTRTFPRGKKPANLFFVTMTEYEKGLPVSAVAFLTQNIPIPLSRVIAEASLRQFHIAETEKYAHVTYFFNGGREEPYPGEDRTMVPSPKVDTYDQRPEMAAAAITQKLVALIGSGTCDFAVANFANPDMVGHTGVISACVKGIETVDSQLGTVAKMIERVGGAMIVTADHGNAEKMWDPATNQPDTEHNISPVPAIFIHPKLRNNPMQLQTGILSDIAPTILGILKLTKPDDMTGKNLVASLSSGRP